jgi:hypothetical protein
VDDILIVAKGMRDVNKLKTLLSRELDIKNLGTAKKIFMMEIRKDRTTKRL